MNNNWPTAPFNHSLTENYLNKLKIAINYVISGKSNNTGEITLTPSATSSTFTDNLCNVNSVILLTAVTSNAAQYHAGMYVTAGDKTFTIYHSSHIFTDRTFRYVIIG